MKEAVKFAPNDALAREIQEVLECIRPEFQVEVDPRYDGYSVAASEAYLHLAGGRDAGVKVMRHANGDKSHWWLEDDKGRVIDLTLSPADRRRRQVEPELTYPYAEGKPAMFRRGYAKVSRRGAAIIELVRARRAK